jgi:hypothetical protein
MANNLPEGEKCLLTFDNGRKIILLKDEIVNYKAEHKEAIFKRIDFYPPR